MPFVLKCASALSNGTQQDTQLVLLVLEYELKATAYSETTLCCERSDYTRKGEMVNAFCAKVCVKLNRTQCGHLVLCEMRLHAQRRNSVFLLC